MPLSEGRSLAVVRRFEGLTGWLIPVGIIVVFAPFGIGLSLVWSYGELFTEGLWVELTSPESDWYHPLWKPYIIGQNVAALVLMLVWIRVARLFYGKKTLFRRTFVLVATGTLGLTCVQLLVVKVIYPEQPLLGSEDTGGLIEQFVMFGIFVPYVIFSRRVKAVFSN